MTSLEVFAEAGQNWSSIWVLKDVPIEATCTSDQEAWEWFTPDFGVGVGSCCLLWCRLGEFCNADHFPEVHSKKKKKNQNSAFNFFLVKVTHLIIEQVTLPFFSFLKEWVLLCFSLRTVLEWEHTEFIYLFIHSFFKKQGCLLYILNVSQGFTLGCFSKQFLLQI